MVKKSNLLLFGILLFLIPFSAVNATDCTNDNLSLLKKWASNVNYDYSYVEQNDKAIFKIRFTNLNQNIVLKDTYHNQTYSNNNEIVIDGFDDGKTYSFQLAANDQIKTVTYYVTQLIGDEFVDVPLELPAEALSCQGEILTTLYVTLPKYNQFYNSNICKENKTNKLCAKWYKHNLSFEEFTKEIENSKKNQNDDKNKKTKNENILTQFLKLYQDRPVIMFGGTAFVLIVLIILIMFFVKRNKSGFEGW